MNYQSYYDEEIDINKDIPDINENPKSVTMKHENGNSSNDIKKSINLNNSITKNDDSIESDTSDISKSDEIKNSITKKFINPDKWKNLNVQQDIKDLFQYIANYIPQNIDIDYTLQPFIPDYVPAVGDVDAFLKVTPSECFDQMKQDQINDMIKNLGLCVLDEPNGNQSEPSLLNMRLKSVLTTTINTNSSIIQTPVAKSDRDIQKWINEIEQLHVTQSRKSTILNDLLQLTNIDALMAEWPTVFEQKLNGIGFPFYNIGCNLELYISIICALFDIPIFENNQYHYIIAIYTLFNLFLATNNTSE